jgi:hypothetical protein
MARKRKVTAGAEVQFFNAFGDDAVLPQEIQSRIVGSDILVLVVLARSPHPLRFHRVRDACSGGSQTGVWNSLERLADRDYVAVSGKPGGHRYWIAETGVVKLKYLSDR